MRLLFSRPRTAAFLLRAFRLVPGRSLRSALQRSLAWRLVDDLPARVRTSSVGGRMVVDTRDLVGRVLAISGEWEPHVTESFRRELGAGDVCVDVGAHIGYYTLLASKLVGSRGHVYALEPSPGSYRALRENIALNGSTNVTAVNVAAGAGAGTAVLHQGPATNTGLSSLRPGVVQPDAPVEVPVGAVDALLQREAFDRVRMIKVDVEGYEVEVLRGLERILAAGAPIALIVELSPEWSAEDPARFVEELCRRHGLVPWRLVNEYSLEGHFPARLESPVRVGSIPAGRCDLLLTRRRGTE